MMATGRKESTLALLAGLLFVGFGIAGIYFAAGEPLLWRGNWQLDGWMVLYHVLYLLCVSTLCAYMTGMKQGWPKRAGIVLGAGAVLRLALDAVMVAVWGWMPGSLFVAPAVYAVLQCVLVLVLAWLSFCYLAGDGMAESYTGKEETVIPVLGIAVAVVALIFFVLTAIVYNGMAGQAEKLGGELGAELMAMGQTAVTSLWGAGLCLLQPLLLMLVKSAAQKGSFERKLAKSGKKGKGKKSTKAPRQSVVLRVVVIGVSAALVVLFVLGFILGTGAPMLG